RILPIHSTPAHIVLSCLLLGALLPGVSLAQDFSFSPLSLSFAAGVGNFSAPEQLLSVTSEDSAFDLVVTTTTADGGGWLKASTSNKALPATIRVTADPTGLQPGTYQG